MEMARAANTATGLTASQQWHAVSAGFLGWTMDAFDFFVVVFMIGTLAENFRVPKSAIVWTMTATLAFRPLGAFIFGLLADRYGRRMPLMANVVYFSLIEVLCGFAPNYTVFLILRALYGIGMGGEWGVGASLAMESTPHKWRGFISGLLQSGYSWGYLLAALAYRFVFPSLGWRWMFWIGGVPALLALYIRFHVPESEAWKQQAEKTTGAILKVLRGYWRPFLYLCLMMTLFMFLSHGTQDLYPDFLRTEHKFHPNVIASIAMIYNVGAIVGRHSVRHTLANLGTETSDRILPGGGLAGNSGLGVRERIDRGRGVCLLNAGWRPRRLGRSAGAPERTCARRSARPGAGTGVSDRHSSGRWNQHDRICPPRPFRLPMGAGRL